MKVCVVIASYKVKNKILDVIGSIGPEVTRIYVIDDKCPDFSGNFVQTNCQDQRVRVLYHDVNQGVGGAVITGYKQAISEDMDVVVKIDGDGQMDPRLIPLFINPICLQQCDYTKGNRFYKVEDISKMPIYRVVGNAVLSFFSKISSGYWQIFDPTNGYTAISIACLKNIDLDKIDKRYFFESDLLFRLGIVGASIKDIPMKAVYEDEVSNLRVKKILIPFLNGHIKNTLKRLFYDYILRDFSLASISFVWGITLLTFGLSFGIYQWQKAIQAQVAASSGTVMLAALPIIIGTQFLLSFLNYDINKSRNRNSSTFELKRRLQNMK